MRIKASVLKGLLAVSAFLTATQARAANAQMVYMPYPGPNPVVWGGFAAVAAFIIFALIGFIVVIKWIVHFIIKLFKKS